LSELVLPNDANPLGFILGGKVMHLIDIAGAIACHRHAHLRVVTVAVDSLEFIYPIKVGDTIVLKSRVTAAFTTSMEVEVEVFCEEVLSGNRRMTSRAYVTYVAVDDQGHKQVVPPLRLNTVEDQQRRDAAQARRADRLSRRVTHS
jgi:acyl-CoA hydrolase